MVEQPVDGCRVEEVGVVFQREGQEVILLGRDQRQVELHRAQVEGHRFESHPSQVHPRSRLAEREGGKSLGVENLCLLEDEHHLEDGRAARVAL